MSNIEYQCADPGCSPSTITYVSNLKYCQFACLSDINCRTVTFNEFTNQCIRFPDIPSQYGNMVVQTGITTMTALDDRKLSAPHSSSICANSTYIPCLYANQFIYSPTNHRYAAGMLNNQFGVYNAYGYNNVTSTAIWTASQLSTPADAALAAQNDRNLVVYGGGIAIWASNTYIPGTLAAFCLQLLENGTLIWTDTTGSIIWHS